MTAPASTAQVPPQNIEAEESVLGAMLVAESALTRVIDEVGLNAEDFYLEKHSVIFGCARDLYAASKPVDELLVTDELQRRGEVEAAGGKHYVSELAAKVPAAGNAKHYAEIVLRHASQREFLNILREMAVPGLNGDGPDKYRRLGELMNGMHGRLEARPADLSRVRPVRWLWERRLPLGYLSLLLGTEGVGKGTFAAWLIARVTRGELRGDIEGKPAKVLLVGDEDSFDSVVMPRLYAAGADLGLVDRLSGVAGDDYLDVRRDAESLRALVLRHGYRLVFLDALLDTLGVDIDDWRAKAVRDALRPLRRVARDVDVVVLGALHPNKGSRPTFRDLLSGSHAFNAVSRSSLLLAKHPDDEDRRILVRGKGNLSADPRAFEFAIHGCDLEINGHGFSLSLVADEGETDLTIEDVIAGKEAAPQDQEKEPSKRQVLAARLVEALSETGPLGQADALRRVGEDPNSRTGRRALQEAVEEGFLVRLPDGRYEFPAGVAGTRLPYGERGA